MLSRKAIKSLQSAMLLPETLFGSLRAGLAESARHHGQQGQRRAVTAAVSFHPARHASSRQGRSRRAVRRCSLLNCAARDHARRQLNR